MWLDGNIGAFDQSMSGQMQSWMVSTRNDLKVARSQSDYEVFFEEHLKQLGNKTCRTLNCGIGILSPAKSLSRESW